MFTLAVFIICLALWLCPRPVTAPALPCREADDADPHRAAPGLSWGTRPTIRRWRGGRARKPETEPDSTEPCRGA